LILNGLIFIYYIHAYIYIYIYIYNIYIYIYKRINMVIGLVYLVLNL
jgi:hypothetical protein